MNSNVLDHQKRNLCRSIRIRIVLLVSVILMIGCANVSEQSNNKAEVPCCIYFDIDCEENLFLAKYDIELLWDAQSIGTMEHGKSFTCELATVSGSHQLKAKSVSDNDVYGIVRVETSGDATIHCVLHSKTKSIEISDLEIINGEPHRPVVPNVIGLTYGEAKKQLTDAGFINIEYNTNDQGSIWAENSWDVTEQSIEPGSSADKTETIILTCIRHVQLPTTLELITEEGGVVAFSGHYRHSTGNTYVIADCNTNTLYRISPSADSVNEHTISGDINGTFKAGNYQYHIYTITEDGITSISYIHEEFNGNARTNKSAKLKKTDLAIAYRIMEQCYANAEAEAKCDPYSDHFCGKTVFFGQYEQQYSSKGNPEPIEWIVLCSEGEQTLLISKYILTFMQYSDAIGDSSDCIWKNSTVRTWLNTSFLEDAFSPEEAAYIRTTEIKDGNITTSDRVFLLNSSELYGYFNSISTKAKPSRYAEYLNESNHLGGNITTWWLRSSGSGFMKPCVDLNGETNSIFVERNLGIRPAIWVNSSALQMPEE